MKVIYEIDLAPENAKKIDQINKILLGESYEEEAPAKPAKGKSGSLFEDSSDANDCPDLDSFTSCAKNCKEEHGEEFCMLVLEDEGIETAKTLRGSVKKVPEEKRRAVMKLWVKGPQKGKSDDWEEEEEEEEEDTSKVTSDAVKKAVKAYAEEHSKEKAKKVMSACGFGSLAAINDDADEDDLKKLFKKVCL
jgi:hypothetical protein